MNVEDFFAEFRMVAPEYEWFIDPRGRILGKKEIGKKTVQVCPVVAHYTKCGNTSIRHIQYPIFAAADNRPDHDPELRKRLLEICKC